MICPSHTLLSFIYSILQGGYRVSTACFAFLTHQLQSLAGGRVELILEGGYNIDILCDSVEQCCRYFWFWYCDKT
jgi:hypothetical protein